MVNTGNFGMDARLREMGCIAQQNTLTHELPKPPFFAFFERILSGIAYLLDPTITTLSKEAIATWPVIAFQRSSVIVSELVLGFALYRCVILRTCPHNALTVRQLYSQRRFYSSDYSCLPLLTPRPNLRRLYTLPVQWHASRHPAAQPCRSSRCKQAVLKVPVS
jgi:hypothetical protein